MDTKPQFPVRGSRPNFGEGTTVPGYVNNGGELLVAAGLPAYTQLVSRGDSWWASTTTAAAPVVAIPTTAGLIGLWNGDSEKSYVIDSVFVVVVAATAAVQATGIMANISTSPVLAAIANTIAPRPLFANRAYAGNARIAVGITLDAANGVAANWMQIGGAIPGINTTQVGSQVDIDIGGKIILPPTGQLALTAVSGAATASSLQIGFRWHEVRFSSI